MTTRERTRAQLLIVAELTLAAVSVAAVLSLRRVFQDGSFLGPVLSTVLLGHLVAALLRRRKVPHMEIFTARSVRIHATRPLRRELDGDVIDADHDLSVEVMPEALLVCVPR